MFGNEDFVEDIQAPDEENARRFFGFSPHEQLDAFVLRARKMKRDDQARTVQDRELVRRFFAVLAPLVGIPAAPVPEPPQEPAPTVSAANVSTPAPEPCTPRPPAVVQSVLDRLRDQLDYALHTQVIQHTIVAYDRLFASLVHLAQFLGVDPKSIGNTWVRSHMRSPAPETVSRAQLEEVLELLPERLHVSLGGTPEYNHPHHRYIARAPEARLGLQFEYILNAIRARAEEMLANDPRAQWFFP